MGAGSVPLLIGCKESVISTSAPLVTEWILCAACGPAFGPLVDAPLDGGPVSWLPPGDIPGHRLVRARFAPSSGGEPPPRPAPCRIHQAGPQASGTGQQPISALGAIEIASWPLVSGWAADPSGQPLTARLEIEGMSADLPLLIARPDVIEQLGTPNASGFYKHVDELFGYGFPAGTTMRLLVGTEVVAHAHVSRSEVMSEDAEGTCGTWLQGVDEVVPDLARRFREASIAKAGLAKAGDARAALVALGMNDAGREGDEWEAALGQRGAGSMAVAGLLARREMAALGVPYVDPLPAAVADAVAALGTLPAQVASWSERMVETGTESESSESFESSGPAIAGVCVTGLVSHPSTLGTTARAILRTLQARGVHACAESFFPSVGDWNPRLSAAPSHTTRLADHVAILSLPLDRTIASLACQPALLASPEVIGSFTWDFAQVPPQHARALDLLDAIWAPSSFSAQGLASATSTPVHVVGRSIDVSDVAPVSRRALRTDEDAFLVLVSFDANATVALRNPVAAIRAFQLAFPDDPGATLVLKARTYGLVADRARAGCPHSRALLALLQDEPRVRVFPWETTHATTLGMIAAADCVMSTHRAESFGHTLAEAMALGTPVIATRHGGNLDFMGDEEAWLIDHELIDVLPGECGAWTPGMQWAEVDLSAAAAALIAVRAGTGVAERTIAARARVERECSTEAFGERMAGLLPAFTR